MEWEMEMDIEMDIEMEIDRERCEVHSYILSTRGER